MASNILTAERRWASTRKSGMTILGKVPKPINLPSQRLENNGLDPNVEIVPKGTLTWGGRSSSATPNVWSSSTILSPKADGSTGSPCHYNGRPSSGGNGTRPSTAGSDKSQESFPSAWGSSSRPSTASGILPSNQTPMAAHPQSAETRPGSSQLSRFAENSVEPAIAWGSVKTAEKLRIASSKTDGFSLSSGDFPTLGSEKKSEAHIQQGHSSQGQTAAASGTLEPSKKLELPMSGDDFMDHGNVSTLKTDRNSNAEGGAPLNTKCQNNLQQEQPYQSLKITSHEFDSWYGHPVHPPDGIWYRGGAIGGPYRPAGPPGIFPVDPSAYQPRQFPPNSEAVPRPGIGLVNYHPANGETYLPQVLPNSYMFSNHPIIPARPGPYQAPVPCDGYYSYHQTSLCNPGEQQISSTGMATRPSVYNQHSDCNGNFISETFQNNPGGDDSQVAKEQMSSDRAHVPRQGHCKVLLKQHCDLEDKYPQEKEQYEPSTQTHSDVKPKQGGSNSKLKVEQSVVSRKNEKQKNMNLAIDQASSKQASDCEVQLSTPVVTNLHEHPCRISDGILKREPDAAIPVVHDQKHYPVIRKNSVLIGKIEGLNNKVRSANSFIEVGQLPFRQEKSKQSKVINAKPEHSTIFSNAAPTEYDSTSSSTSSTMAMPVTSEGSPSNVFNNPQLSIESTAVLGPSESQDIGKVKPDSLKPNEVAYSHVPKRTHVTQSWNDYHAKSRSDNQFDIGCASELSGRDSSFEPEKTDAGGLDTGILESQHLESIWTSSSDLVDYKTQRAKSKEMAIQRAKQLQKEEEEKTREQKAKALAKLEELNKRSAAQIIKQKLKVVSPRNTVQLQEDSGVDAISQTSALASNTSGDTRVGNTERFLQASDCEKRKHGTPIALPLTYVSSTSRIVSQDSAVHDPPVSLGHENTTQNIGSETHVCADSKHKQMSYRRRQKFPLEKNSGERPIMVENVGSKYDEVVRERSPDEKPDTTENKVSPENPVEIMSLSSSNDRWLHDGDPSVQNKKKNSRNSRNKNKDEALMGSSLPASVQSHENVEEHPCEDSKPHSPALVAETLSIPAQVSAGNSESQDQQCSKIIEEAHGRMSNQWKPQPPRRPARNQQVNRHMDKVHGSEAVIWAPVKPANKNEQSDESSQSSVRASNCQSSRRNEPDMHNGVRTKRAELERYVPKPVAKELLQQDNTRKSSSYVNQSGDMPEKPYLDSKGSGMAKFDGSSRGRTDFIADTKNGEDDKITEDNKPGKRGRAHSSWRQRSSSESTIPLQGSNEGLNSSDATKLFNKPSDQHLQLPEQLESGGWESSGNPVPKGSTVLPAVTKEQGVTNRQRRQQVDRDAGSNFVTPNHRHLQGGIDDRNSADPPRLDLNDTDARNSVKGDNKNTGGEHIRTQSHWKPKSQPHNQKQGSRGNGGRRISSYDGKSEKFVSSGFETNPSCDETKSTFTQKDGSYVVMDAGNQAKGASNSVPSKERMHNIPNQDVQTNTDLPPGSTNAQHDNQVSPGQHGHRNGRFNRGQEATYCSRDFVQITGKSNVQVNGDSPKNNSHFEYQAIGSYNKPGDICQSKSIIDQEAHGHHAARQRYKERGQAHTRNRGHFFRRNTGATADVDDS